MCIYKDLLLEQKALPPCAGGRGKIYPMEWLKLFAKNRTICNKIRNAVQYRIELNSSSGWGATIL